MRKTKTNAKAATAPKAERARRVTKGQMAMGYTILGGAAVTGAGVLALVTAGLTRAGEAMLEAI